MSQRINLRLEPLSPPMPGMAKLIIKGWEGELNQLQFTIQRNQDHYYLDDAGEWGAGTVKHTVVALEEEGEVHILVFTANILDPLLKLTGASYRLTLNDADGNKSAGTIMMPTNLLSSEAAGSTPQSSVVITAPKPIPEPEPIIESESSTEPEPAIVLDLPHAPENETGLPNFDSVVIPPESRSPNRNAQKKSKGLLFILLGLLFLVVVGGTAAAYFLGLFSSTTPEATPEAQTQAEPESPAPPENTGTNVSASISAPCSIETAKAAENEIEFVKSCMKSSPSTVDLIQVIQDAKANKLCTVAQRIYAYKSQSGDKTIALAYAKEFDPATHVPEGCFTADAQTAVYWYEAVLAQDSANVEAKARVDALKK